MSTARTVYPKYKRVRGTDQSVYRIPEGIGMREQLGTERAYSGWVWLDQSSVTNMLTLRSNDRVPYVGLHAVKIGRTRWTRGVTLQTIHPDMK